MTQQTHDPLETPETDRHGGCRATTTEQASTYEGLFFIERLSLLVEHEQLEPGAA